MTVNSDSASGVVCKAMHQPLLSEKDTCAIKILRRQSVTNTDLPYALATFTHTEVTFPHLLRGAGSQSDVRVTAARSVRSAPARLYPQRAAAAARSTPGTRHRAAGNRTRLPEAISGAPVPADRPVIRRPASASGSAPAAAAPVLQPPPLTLRAAGGAPLTTASPASPPPHHPQPPSPSHPRRPPPATALKNRD
ncbi:translation initiation factor IF-2-like [Schistocerca serialis cubense]|uniref:translation initiation factor IF-2-like n=1 Tax=Schistocerca serialis cubense TaxID=2023355 RepID=UPI00214F0035|nr:translation initiation factor IF-2-like [Schistocerca serialis cubense]